MNTETTVVLAVVTVFGGLGALIQSGWTLFTILRWQRARATVLRYRVSVGDGGRFFHPVYRFQTGAGEAVTAISSWASWRRPWNRGDEVEIRFDPESPRHSEIQCFGNNWGLAATCLGLVALFWTAALLVGAVH